MFSFVTILQLGIDGSGFVHTTRDSTLLTAPPAHRTLPLSLVEGQTVSAELMVSDLELAAAAEEGTLQRPELTLRFSAFCVDDNVEISLHSACGSFRLDLSKAERWDERGLSIALSTNLHSYTKHPMFDAPLGFAAYWFRWQLPVTGSFVSPGVNVVAVRLIHSEPTAKFERALNG